MDGRKQNPEQISGHGLERNDNTGRWLDRHPLDVLLYGLLVSASIRPIDSPGCHSGLYSECVYCVSPIDIDRKTTTICESCFYCLDHITVACSNMTDQALDLVYFSCTHFRCSTYAACSWARRRQYELHELSRVRGISSALYSINCTHHSS